MNKSNINPHFYPANLAHQKRLPKHLCQCRDSNSDTSSNNTSNSNASSKALIIDTRATTLEPIQVPCFPLRTLLRDPTIYPTHKFIDFHPSPIPSQCPYISDNLPLHLILLHTTFHHITHTYSLKHETFCKDSYCMSYH